MMPENLANKIAAGEVVQRPESVLKEALENALDANSDSIEVIIKNAGKSLIQIIDNGDGMSEEDAELSIQRHSTSKVYSYEDLERIRTFGFRGEALSSIAAVSQLEIKTRTAEQELGTYIKVEDNKIIEKGKEASPKGTSICIRNLFYNTPARRNFLKTDTTELKHLIETFKRTALSSPHVSFKFWNDDDLTFDFPAGSLDDRMSQVFADNILDAVLRSEENTDFLKIKGYIAKPAYLRKSKGDQYLYINNRYVVSKQVNHAVFTAYENVLEKGDYPFFVLFLQIDPGKIDVNVHPSKLEVKFDDERDIYSFVLAVMRKTLSSYDLVPNMSFNDPIDGRERLAFNDNVRTERNDFTDRPVTSTGNGGRSYSYNAPAMERKRYSDEDIDQLFNSLDKKIENTIEGGSEQAPSSGPRFIETPHRELGSTEKAAGNTSESLIFQIHNKYIVAQIRNGLMLIDQHAAHERILYEKALRAFEANLPFSQQLMFPQTIQFDPASYAVLKELGSYLTKLGFDIRFFSKNTVSIIGIPQDVRLGSEEKILQEIISEYIDNQREKGIEATDNLAKSYSCKAAIKAGDKLNENEMRILVDQLFGVNMPYHCPHGRPTVIKINLEELDRRFGRT
jgi:DNA mismatch repair protein MutL